MLVAIHYLVKRFDWIFKSMGFLFLNEVSPVQVWHSCKGVVSDLFSYSHEFFTHDEYIYWQSPVGENH